MNLFERGLRIVSGIKGFGDTAKGLSRNPLGIIALFIVMVYGFATLVLALGDNSLSLGERTPIIWFLVIFPVIVLFVFAWLVIYHHRKLYSPGDFRDEQNFLKSIRPGLIKFARTDAHPVSDNQPNMVEFTSNDSATSSERSRHRDEIYQTNRGVFITHVLAPSREHGQEYDIFIYLLRHKNDDFSDVIEAEFFLGSYWGNKILNGTRSGDTIGIRVSAYGPFLCTCTVTFNDGAKTTLDRYIDFEMGKVLRDIDQSG